MNPLPRQYLFEREHDPRKRTRKDAIADAKVLLYRLLVTDDEEPETPPAAPVMNFEERNLLVRYCLETTLNIRWYEWKNAKERRWRTGLTVFTVVVGLAVLVMILLIPWLSAQETTSWLDYAVAQLGFLALGCLGILELVVTTLDTRERIRIFWQASSELKQQVYSFESQWKGRAVDAQTNHLLPEFVKALSEAVESARKLVRAEREQFFTTLASPTSILDSLRQDVTGVIGWNRLQTSDIQSRSVARSHYLEVAAKLEAARYNLARIQQQFPDDEDLVRQAEYGVLAAESELMQVRAGMGMTTVLE